MEYKSMNLILKFSKNKTIENPRELDKLNSVDNNKFQF